MYCNDQGRCVPEKKLGERCTQHEDCGRKGMCIFPTTLSTYGACTELTQQSDNTLVLPMYKTDMAETDTKLTVKKSAGPAKSTRPVEDAQQVSNLKIK